MTDETPQDENGKSLSDTWSAEELPDYGDFVFKPDEVDIYANKLTYETFIFHGKKVDYPGIDHLEYNPDDYSVTFVYKDGGRKDLGVKIQWLVRPYISKTEEISIVRTKDGVSIDGHVVPLVKTGGKA